MSSALGSRAGPALSSPALDLGALPSGKLYILACSNPRLATPPAEIWLVWLSPVREAVFQQQQESP